MISLEVSQDIKEYKENEKYNRDNEKIKEKNKEDIKEYIDDKEDKEIVEVNDLECIIRPCK